MISTNNALCFRLLIVIMLGIMIVIVSFLSTVMIFYLSAILCKLLLNVPEERLTFQITDVFAVANMVALFFTISILTEDDVAGYLISKDIQRYRVVSSLMFFLSIYGPLYAYVYHLRIFMEMLLPHALFGIAGSILTWLSADFSSLRGRRGTYLMSMWSLFLGATAIYEIMNSLHSLVKAVQQASLPIVLITLFLFYLAIKDVDEPIKMLELARELESNEFPPN